MGEGNEDVLAGRRRRGGQIKSPDSTSWHSRENPQVSLLRRPGEYLGGGGGGGGG